MHKKEKKLILLTNIIENMPLKERKCFFIFTVTIFQKRENLIKIIKYQRLKMWKIQKCVVVK